MFKRNEPIRGARRHVSGGDAPSLFGTTETRMQAGITIVAQSELPARTFSRELEGGSLGVPASVIFVDAAPGEGPSLHLHPYAAACSVRVEREVGDQLVRGAWGAAAATLP